MKATTSLQPVVLYPSGKLTKSKQGQPLRPVVHTKGKSRWNVSSGEVEMPGCHTSNAHVHHRTDVIVILPEWRTDPDGKPVRNGDAITVWWDEHGVMHLLPQGPGGHLPIPHGVPHAAINPYDELVQAIEVRPNGDFTRDNDLLPHLQGELEAALLRERTRIVAEGRRWLS